MKVLWTVIPFIPFLTRLILIGFFRTLMKDILEEEELDRDSHRNYILAMTGFSFSGLLAVTLLEATVIQGFNLTIFYLFISFLFFLFSLNFQGYKSRRWQDQLSTAFTEIASLSLILSIISVLFIKKFDQTFSLVLSILAFSIWSMDHIIRLCLQSKYLFKKKER
ncbi:MAG: hypothetical protein HND52_20760 [Ignavibacteriae bacterium]|nr:hypothetical protein [Ignavibacteriota bacterium]NOH00404.1 hypothetical protein [Ignavibacteriota bacterium]